MASKALSQVPEAEKDAVPLETVKKLMLIVLYIAVSTSLIRFNKFMMATDRFPYSMCLTSCHMLMSLSLCLIMYAVNSAAFPGVVNAEGKKLLVLRWMVPIGLTFAVALFTSNQAYMYCSVSFLQFMKEGNVIIMFLLSCAVGLQSMDRMKFALMVWIIGGEMHFMLIGFLCQLLSMLAECTRAVMGEIVLGGGGLKLDPLSYTMFVAPTCLVALMVGTAATWDPAIPAAFMENWRYILPNSMIAFVLNILIAAMIKEISAVGFVLAGLCKDVFLVVLSCLEFGDVVTLQQWTSFVLILSGVGFWSLMKTSPDSTVVKSVAMLLGMPSEREKSEPSEKTALIPSSNKL